MSLADALSKRRKELKKAPTPRGETGSKVPCKLLCSNSADYHRLMSETYMEKYWTSIQHLSFGSVFLPMKKETAKAIIASNTAYVKNPTKATSLGCVRSSPALRALSEAIDGVRSSKKWPGIFIRLSSRSPKDAALSEFRFRREFDAQLKYVVQTHKADGVSETESPPYNQRLQALYRASTYCLRSPSGEHAVSLLVESQRIQEDLVQFVKASDGGTFNVVVREFRTFDPEMELRAFVHEDKLTALTQYNNLCYFPRFARNADAICELVKAQFPTISRSVPLKSYVLDLVLCPAVKPEAKDTDIKRAGAAEQADTDPSARGGDSKRNEAVVVGKSPESSSSDYLSGLELKVIEVNPLAEFAGSGLFSWERPADNQVLLGKKPFEFRYRKRAPAKGYALTNMAPKWKSVIESGSTS